MTEFKNFSASKLSENPRFSVSVEYTDFMGTTHRIVCKSRKALNSAREFRVTFRLLVSVLFLNTF